MDDTDLLRRIKRILDQLSAITDDLGQMAAEIKDPGLSDNEAYKVDLSGRRL